MYFLIVMNVFTCISIEKGYKPIPDSIHRSSPGINRAPIARMKMILIPIESLNKNLQF